MNQTFPVDDTLIRRLLPTIDYSDPLRPDATEADVIRACEEGTTFGFRAVVAFPHYLPLVVRELSRLRELREGAVVRAQLAVGFPSGAVTTATKCRETEEGLRTGANDFDMVMNVGAFKSGDFGAVRADIEAVGALVRPEGHPLKVILEVGFLNEAEIVAAATLVADAGATHVKTCTGFGPGRATLRNIGLLRAAVGRRLQIKASGGVASIEDALSFLDAGAAVVAARGWLVDQLRRQGFTP